MQLKSSKKHFDASMESADQQRPNLDIGGESLLIGKLSNRKSRVKRAVYVIAIVAIGVAVYLWYAPPVHDVAEVIANPVNTGEFTIKISEIGVLRALDSITVSAEKDLPIIWLAPEGSTVKKGDVVVGLDATKYELQYESTQALVEVAEADVQKAMKDVEAKRQRLLADNARFHADVELAQIVMADLKRKPLPVELERAKGEFEKAELAVEATKRRWQVMPELLKRGYIEGSDYDEAKSRWLEAQINLRNVNLNLKMVSAGATEQELKQAQIRLTQSQTALAKAKSGMISEIQSFQASVVREKANLRRAMKELKRSFAKRNRKALHAPRDGLVVYAVNEAKDTSRTRIQLGMIPFKGQPLIYLPDLSTMVVDTEVNEFDIGKVKIGSPVVVSLEAFPGIIFDGEIQKIGALARLKRSANGVASGVKAFNVIIRFNKQDPRLKPGLTANLDIIAYRRNDALSVPLVAVTARNNQHFVRVVGAEGIEERAVVLGPSNESSVIVEEGLRPEDKVVVNFRASVTQ